MVYAVDPNPAVEVAKLLAQANGLADRIRFLQIRSDQLVLDEPVDGMISDIRGPLPLIPENLPATADARSRLLKPGGWQCPQSDTLYIALLSSPGLFANVVGPYWNRPDSFDFTSARRWVVNQIASYRRFPGEKATAAQCLGTLDYRTLTNRDFQSKVAFAADEKMVVHGAVMWFDAQLDEGISYTTNPFAEGKSRAWVYGNTFLPFGSPLSIEPGDQIEIDYRALDTTQGFHYYWSCLRERQGVARQERKHSTFLGRIFTPSAVKRQSELFVPALSQEAQVTRHLLNLVGDGRTNADLARSLMEAFPQKFKDYPGSLTYVAGFCSSQSL